MVVLPKQGAAGSSRGRRTAARFSKLRQWPRGGLLLTALSTTSTAITARFQAAIIPLDWKTFEGDGVALQPHWGRGEGGGRVWKPDRVPFLQAWTLAHQYENTCEIDILAIG